MRSIGKGATGAFVGVALVLAGVQPAQATSAHQSLSPNASEVIEGSVDLAQALTEFGITESDLVTIGPSEEGFFEEVAAIALAGESEPEASSNSAIACSLGERTTYAAQIAATNLARDARARTLAEETMYMYLSHYVDMSPSHYGSTCSHHSESSRYAAWITNDDRNAYNSFLSIVNLTDKVTAFSDAIGTASLLSGAPALPKHLGNAADNVRTVLEGTDYGLTAISAVELGDRLLESHRSGASATQAIADLHDSFSPDVPREYAEAGVGIATALYAKSTVTALSRVGFKMLPVAVMIGTSIANSAALTGLIYSSNSRISGRMMRYLGM